MRHIPAPLRITAALTALGIVLASCGGAAEPAATAVASVAPTQAATAAAAPAPKGALILVADTTSGSIGTTDEEKAALSCVQKNRFPQGESIVWRVRVEDGISGKAMDDKALKSVELTLPDGKTQPLKYGPHPKGKTDDYFWTTSYKLAPTYPTGAFTYSLRATSLEGAVGTFDQFNVASSMLQVIKAGTK